MTPGGATDPSFRCEPLSPALQPALTAFFQAVVSAGLDRDFHPHPFTPEEAARLAQHRGSDYYVAMLSGADMAGYGMLRGWDEGYAVPSLGLALLPAFQRRGGGRQLMLHLHGVARERGARRIRLKVYRRNRGAIALYSSLGYTFQDFDAEQHLGVLEL